MDYNNTETIVTLSFDDGKANVVGHAFIDALSEALDRAEHEAEEDRASALILRGRKGLFSAGFDLREFEKGSAEGAALALRGFKLLIRLYSFPLPLIAASTGHGIAMGAFIIMACDHRLGTTGEFKMSLPETAIGMDLPEVLLALTESRITPQHMTRVALLSEPYDPELALEAGFIDELVSEEELQSRSHSVAQRLGQLPRKQFARNKLAVRADTLNKMQMSVARLAAAQAT